MATKVLITGASGFLGTHLCRRLLEDGFDVRAFVRKTSNVEDLSRLATEKATGDVKDMESLKAAISGCDLVIHAAAEASHGTVDPQQQSEVNVTGTQNVALACRLSGVQRLIHVSSVAAIGIPPVGGQPADERFSFNLLDTTLSYQISKWRSEQCVKDAVSDGLDAVIVNPAVVCGPWKGSFRGVTALVKAKHRFVIPYTRGGLCFVDVRDVVDGIVKAMTRGRTGRRYILGGDNISFREICEVAHDSYARRRILLPVPGALVEYTQAARKHVRGLLGYPPTPVYARRFCCQYFDSTRAKRELGFRPRSFKDIVEGFLNHYPVSPGYSTVVP